MTNPRIIIEIDKNDEELYSLDVPKIKLSTFYNIISDIQYRIEQGEFSEGQLKHPGIKVTSDDDLFEN